MILAYIGKDIDRTLLIKTFNCLQLDFIELNDKDLDKRIGALLKKEDFTMAPCSRNTFLMFSKISDEQIDSLRNEMKKNRIYVPRIAMETEHNIHWTLKELLDAIDEEVEYFRLRDAVIDKLKKPNFNRIKKDPSYIKNVSEMIDRISSEEITIQELKEFYKYLYKI